MKARAPSDSRSETTHIVLPGDTNTHGTAFGGKIMQWMDIAAAIAAGRHCGKPVVTVAVDDLHFAQPIRMGDLVIVKSMVNYTGRTSMEVGVRVEREDAITHHCEYSLSAFFTFVAVDDEGNPVDVPPIDPQTDDEKRRFENARQRRERRLKAREGRAEQSR